MSAWELAPAEEDLLHGMQSAARRTRFARPIALAGFMGSGKSTLGRRLAEELGRPFHDIDAVIEERTGETIYAMFMRGAEVEFRALERRTIAETVALGNVVMALGGGALLDPSTRELLLRESLLVHLHVPWRDLKAELPALRAGRPVLHGRTEADIHQLYLERMATYRCAHLRVSVPRTGVEQAVRDILERLQHG